MIKSHGLFIMFSMKAYYFVYTCYYCVQEVTFTVSTCVYVYLQLLCGSEYMYVTVILSHHCIKDVLKYLLQLLMYVGMVMYDGAWCCSTSTLVSALCLPLLSLHPLDFYEILFIASGVNQCSLSQGQQCFCEYAYCLIRAVG